ncbi:MAG TPA: DUF3341 domain-containing protein [Candidatus Polarisedimenticolaceae bacterium]|nr:DUF3341 domain-containing protein [Candidatus Polarisedimenticolaceae bacterium]
MAAPLWGLLAEFAGPGELAEAARHVREADYRRWDCFSPFPVHGLSTAMGLRDTRLPWVVLAAGMTGTGTALLMQWWMNGVDYALIIGGKPLFSLPAFVPIMFELTVLFSALSAFAGMFAFNRLPRFYHPVFQSPRFKRVTADRFFLAIEAADPRFHAERTEAFLRTLRPLHVERLED